MRGVEAVADPQPLGVGIKRDAFMARYKAAARFAIETLNAAPPTIAPELGHCRRPGSGANADLRPLDV